MGNHLHSFMLCLSEFVSGGFFVWTADSKSFPPGHEIHPAASVFSVDLPSHESYHSPCRWMVKMQSTQRWKVKQWSPFTRPWAFTRPWHFSQSIHPGMKVCPAMGGAFCRSFFTRPWDFRLKDLPCHDQLLLSFYPAVRFSPGRDQVTR